MRLKKNNVKICSKRPFFTKYFNNIYCDKYRKKIARIIILCRAQKKKQKTKQMTLRFNKPSDTHKR